MYPGTYAKTQPDKVAFVMAETGEEVSYRQLDERSNQLAQLFRDRGLTPGCTIAFVMTNERRFLEVAWAAHRSGLVYVPVNWHLTRDEMAYVVRDCGARVVVASPSHAELAKELLAEIPALEAAFVTGATAIDGVECLDEVASTYPTDAVPDEEMGVDMIYSSGTTGRPKGGTRPRRGVHPADLSPAFLRFFSLFGLSHESVYLSPGAPLYHGAPLRFVMAVMTMGGTVVVMERFDPEAALELIERHGITHSQWVPTMFVRLLRLSETARTRYDLTSHQVALHSAAPCPAHVKERMLEWWGLIVHEYYGGSEGGSLTTIGPQEWLTHRGSVGRSVIGTIHIVDDDGNEVPVGQPGIVAFEGGVPIEYHNDPAKTARSHTQAGWSTVGDVGYLDEEGYLYLTDRKDFTIVSGGVNIYPSEIEAVLIGHPGVADVAVFGIPNEEFGEEVKAVIEPVADVETDALGVELAALCRQQLAAYKWPRSFDVVAELPRSPAGKLYKGRLRDEYWKSHTTRVI